MGVGGVGFLTSGGSAAGAFVATGGAGGKKGFNSSGGDFGVSATRAALSIGVAWIAGDGSGSALGGVAATLGCATSTGARGAIFGAITGLEASDTARAGAGLFAIGFTTGVTSLVSGSGIVTGADAANLARSAGTASTAGASTGAAMTGAGGGGFTGVSGMAGASSGKVLGFCATATGVFGGATFATGSLTGSASFLPWSGESVFTVIGD